MSIFDRFFGNAAADEANARAEAAEARVEELEARGPEVVTETVEVDVPVIPVILVSVETATNTVLARDWGSYYDSGATFGEVLTKIMGSKADLDNIESVNVTSPNYPSGESFNLDEVIADVMDAGDVPTALAATQRGGEGE